MKSIQKEISIFNDKLKYTLALYPNKIAGNISEFIFSKSKKLRPSLILLMSKALDIEPDEDVYILAVATELIHNATLIHDDIIDNAITRRGKLSLNKQLGNNLSVLAGDFLLSAAMKELNKFKNFEVLNIFNESLTNMCKGEINQYFTINSLPEMDEYIEKSRNKTAELFYASLKSLYLIKNIKELKEISDFSINFGIAFQIHDDLTNILMTDKTKPVLSDIYNGIYTLPVILLAQKNNNFINLTKDEIINGLTFDTDIIRKTENIINEYAIKAIDSLKFIRDNQYKKEIINLTENLYKAN